MFNGTLDDILAWEGLGIGLFVMLVINIIIILLLSKQLSERAKKVLIGVSGLVGVLLFGLIIFGVIEGSWRTWEFLVDIIGNLTITALLIYSINYNISKAEEYKSDERWKAIIAKVNHSLINYCFAVVLAITFILMIVFNFFIERDFYMNFGRVIQVAFFVLCSRYIIEMVMLKKYDKTM